MTWRIPKLATDVGVEQYTEPQVAVLVKTLLRERPLMHCVESLVAYLPEGWFRLYVADDGPVSEAKESLYEDLSGNGHVIVKLPADTGASKARNILVDKLQDERYVLRMDDDFALCRESNVPAMARILEAEPRLGSIADLERQVGKGKGVVSGGISWNQGFMHVRADGALEKRFMPPSWFRYHDIAGYRVAYCDYTRNMLLLRREVFESVRWEEQLPFTGEHEDLLLQLKSCGYLVGFTPDSIHEHRDDLTVSDGAASNYTKARDRLKVDRTRDDVFRKKWGVTRIVYKQSPVLAVLRRVRRILHAVSSLLSPEG